MDKTNDLFIFKRKRVCYTVVPVTDLVIQFFPSRLQNTRGIADAQRSIMWNQSASSAGIPGFTPPNLGTLGLDTNIA